MKSIIPFDRPVCGEDIINLRERLGISVSDMMWLLGLTAAHWGEITSDKTNESGQKKYTAPVADPAVALLARWLDAHIDDAARLVPTWPTPKELFDRLKQYPESPSMGTIDRKRLGLCLGRDATTGSRWLMKDRADSGTPANIDRLLYFVTSAIDDRGADAWVEYRRLAQHEASLRGEPNLDQAPGWPSAKSS
ncbi:hypothetical protein [Paramagnetospirillum caucaseum]|uniref:hypothetical protein n=1 Tax=Paramagnetospirillum caucaseum TaxID=1244869 RepID=UPI00058FE9C9|nr:hypothetical protein [Paramagnetospirillum caucaseum]